MHTACRPRERHGPRCPERAGRAPRTHGGRAGLAYRRHRHGPRPIGGGPREAAFKRTGTHPALPVAHHRRAARMGWAERHAPADRERGKRPPCTCAARSAPVANGWSGAGGRAPAVGVRPMGARGVYRHRGATNHATTPMRATCLTHIRLQVIIAHCSLYRAFLQPNPEPAVGQPGAQVTLTTALPRFTGSPPSPIRLQIMQPNRQRRRGNAARTYGASKTLRTPRPLRLKRASAASASTHRDAVASIAA